MKIKRNFILLITIITIFGLSFCQSASATGDQNPFGYTIDKPLEILDSDYLDLDDDGAQDDVITHFIFQAPYGNLAYISTDIYLFLTLPSGTMFYVSYSYTGVYSELPVTFEWYNVATESGDYTVEIFIDAFGWDIAGNLINDLFYDMLIFDPPEFNVGGEPCGKIYIG
ncbi:MAG: hypothetical protein ACTSVU_07955 [Promethearchaeota archaeon]